MNSNTLKNLLKPASKSSFILLLIFACIITYYYWQIGIFAFIALLVTLVLTQREETSKRKLWKEYIENITNDFDATIKHGLAYHPMPLCIFDKEGTILWHNKNFSTMVSDSDVLDKSIEELFSELKIAEILEKKEISPEKSILLTYMSKKYRVSYSATETENGSSIMLYWNDVTNYESLKTLYNEERACIAHINVDNFEDLINGTSEEKRSGLSAQIDKMIRIWAAKYGALITRTDKSKYLLMMESKYFEKLTDTKFDILDEVREIETDTDFPVSLSIGIGLGGKSFYQHDEFAVTALDLALGRGGDQAVVKKVSKIEYYGGRLQAVEKRNKGKSKIMTHALRQLIDQSQKIIIMGHKTPDMDAFGAALGVYRIAVSRNKDTHIIINASNDSIKTVYDIAKDSAKYNFINSEAAIQIITKNTLLIVVDTHRPSYTECPEIIPKVERIVVIDHHRKMEENIENAVLYYMEPYASSTSELITEMLQYMGDKKELTKLEANALLAGITVDTKSFTQKTGVRTFEAASWLRRVGADTISVRQFFQSDLDSFKLKSEIIIGAKIIKDGVALSIAPYKRPQMNLITSQSADELLNIKGIKASFVLGEGDKGEIVISARSLNDVNVQVIIEKMGGGGHLTMAGAQVNMTIKDAEQKLIEIINEHIK